jgi:eukaryotic-like serine/threonine-protein kinase
MPDEPKKGASNPEDDPRRGHASPPEDAWIGCIVSHYRILSKLGEGGMGVVYRALDLSLERAIALKLLLAAKVGNPEREKRFVQEAKAASGLSNPNIVTIYEIGRDGDVDFIAMEYIAGRTLHECIYEASASIAEKLRWAVQIADGLAAAHAARPVYDAR